MFDMARNCNGIERTGCNASLARRVRTDVICEESGGMRVVKLFRTTPRASAKRKLEQR